MEERLKILEMLKDGIISVDEAEELLRTLDKQDNKVTNDKLQKKNNMRMLKVRVNSASGDNVNVNIPVSFLKAAVASGNINNILNKSIKVNGVDQGVIFENIDIDMLIDCINNDFIGNIVDITTAQGDIVQVYFE